MRKADVDEAMHDGDSGWFYSSVSDDVLYFYGALFVVGVGHAM